MEQQEEKKQKISTIKHALFMEDDLLCQRFMTYYLEKLGYQVDLVDDGTKAIQHIDIKIYDLILADIRLKGVSGKEVIEYVRDSELNADTPLIVWSAFVNKNDDEQYLAWGADGVLIKVCQIKELKRAIDRCFLKSRYQRKFHYQLQNFKNKCDRFFNEAERLRDSESVNKFKFSLHEALITIEEHQHWLKLNRNGKQI